jgi:hypothetical protein
MVAETITALANAFGAVANVINTGKLQKYIDNYTNTKLQLLAEYAKGQEAADNGRIDLLEKELVIAAEALAAQAQVQGKDG